MKALTWHGKKDVRIDKVPDPTILDPRDIIIEVTRSAVCGSDLHIYHGHVQEMKKGDILGHEFAGKIVEVGSSVKNLRIGDRVVVPFTISCGECDTCSKGLYSLCTQTNPDKEKLDKVYGYHTAGLFGYSHMYGGYPGGQSQYVRVPFAEVGALALPDEISEEQALFLSDIFPTGYMAAENCNIQPGQTIAIWGCGPVGQFAIRSAFLLGATRVIAIDRFEDRLKMAKEGGADTLDYTKVDILEALKEMTAGKGPDACIDCVGMESHGQTFDAFYDEIATTIKWETDRSHALRQAIQCCANGGTISIPGVYIGLLDKFPLGAAFGKGLTFKMGQTHCQKYMTKLLAYIEKGAIDPTFVITHRLSLDEVPDGYEKFSKKEDNCIKIVISPNSSVNAA